MMGANKAGANKKKKIARRRKVERNRPLPVVKTFWGKIISEPVYINLRHRTLDPSLNADS